MYPESMSSIDWIWKESTTKPIEPISRFDASSTCRASVSRSRMICSTVIEPTIERRWPEKTCPVS